MPKQMMTLKLRPRDATLARICTKFNLSAADLDPEFGIVNIDPKKNLYTILVEAEVAQKLAGREGVAGPYANPRIETFGPGKQKK
jgi:hypothetical protein